jgi:hypothetical protein
VTAELGRAQAVPTLAEDLMLLLFQPGSGAGGTGTIAGEGVLFYTLAGAVLSDLGLGGHVRAEDRTDRVATTGAVPADPLLRQTWDYLAEKPRGVQTVLAAVGPRLREPVLERLVDRGDIRRSTRKALGLFETQVLEGDGGPRRPALVADLRAVLVDGQEPAPRTGALAALLSASGAMPQLHPEIPWTSPVVTRAKALEQGDWGAGAAADAVTRTTIAMVTSNLVIAVAVLPNR